MKRPAQFAHLVDAVCALPGIGRKAGQRIAYFLLQSDERFISDFLQRIANARAQLSFCKRCGNLAEAEECAICTSPGRDHKTVCVVANVEDVYVIEEAGAFDGIYHVLNGELSPRRNVNPEDLRLSSLFDRVHDEDIRELVIATNPTLEGQATALYIKKALVGAPHLIISRLAMGLPSNSAIDYADSATMASAIVNRKRI